MHSVKTVSPVLEPPNFALSPLAAAISFALTVSLPPMTVQAQNISAVQEPEPRQLSTLVAIDTEEDIKVDSVTSPKFTQPLLDTPQTITVITQEVLNQQGAGTLVEALANTPGITLQLGENGNTSAGDNFSIRGSASQTNVFLDGIRDMGAITRDTFNTQQVEIAKGAVGADYGRGTTAGYVNMVSKLPQADEFVTATFSINTGISVRATSDLNNEIGDSGALRLNAMWQNGHAIGRDFVANNSWGVAPSIAFGLNSATRLYLYSQHVRANNVPDGGIPSIGLPGFYNATLSAAGIRPAAVNTANFYGRYDDYEATQADMATLRIEHDFSDGLRLVNSTRYGRSDMERVLTGINALTVSAADPGQWTVARIRQSVTRENKLLTNQTTLTLDFTTGFIEHDLASGLEFTKERQYSPNYSGIGTLPEANLYKPDAYDSYTDTYDRAPNGLFSDGSTRTYAAYAFDTLKFGEQWLLTVGARYDHYKTDYQGLTQGRGATIPTAADLETDGNLLSWKTGVVFKPSVNGSLYLAYSNSLTPPGNDDFVLSATDSSIDNPDFDPAEAENIEIGTKWDLLDTRLALNAALYRTDYKNNLIQTDSVTQEFVQYGRRRVQGVELGMVGKLSDNWQIIAGMAWSDNEQVEGLTGTSANTQNASGSAARWAPEYSGNLWTTYTASKWTTGLGANYVSSQRRITNPDIDASTVAGLGAIPGYAVLNGMVGYDITANLDVQVNVYNLANKRYISSLNNGGSRVRLGTPRYVQVTATFKF